jgi:hypothetical protein
MFKCEIYFSFGGDLALSIQKEYDNKDDIYNYLHEMIVAGKTREIEGYIINFSQVKYIKIIEIK